MCNGVGGGGLWHAGDRDKSCLALPCLVVSYVVLCFVLSCLFVSCLVLFCLTLILGCDGVPTGSGFGYARSRLFLVGVFLCRPPSPHPPSFLICLFLLISSHFPLRFLKVNLIILFERVFLVIWYVLLLPLPLPLPFLLP